MMKLLREQSQKGTLNKESAMRKKPFRFVCFVIFTLANRAAILAAEAKRLPEWDKVAETAKKEGKIVIAIPPAAELRKEMEIVLKQKLGIDAEHVPNPGPRNASRIAAEKKAGVNYFDALIVGTGTALGLAQDGLLESFEPLFLFKAGLPIAAEDALTIQEYHRVRNHLEDKYTNGRVPPGKFAESILQ